MAKEYFGRHSLRSLIRLIQAGLGEKISTKDLINNLDTADPYKPLSAAQGKALKDLMLRYDADNDGIVDDAAKLGGKPAELYALRSEMNEFNVEDQKGQPDGIAPLNKNAKIDPVYLPSYVSETIDVYVDPDTGKVYEDAEHTKEITDLKGDVIYNDVTTGDSYRFGGETISKIPDTSELVEITATEIQEMWNSVFSDKTPGEELDKIEGELGGEDNTEGTE